MKIPSQRNTYLIALIITCILLGTTFYLQKYEGFVPCPLCILQRILLGLVGVLFFLGCAIDCKKIGIIFVGFFASMTSLLGILLAGRQVWLQHLPPDKNADCGVSLQYLLNALPFDQVITKIMQGTAECSIKSWEFLHLGMAEWSLICFSGFFLFCLMQINRAFKSWP